MDRNWSDFKSLYGNLSGAREAFEDTCEALFAKVYKGQSVSQVRVKVGDGGIDIFVGELGVEPIIVIQCKFFLDSFDNSQKAQIRGSFDTAINAKEYELKEWILCIPRVIDIDEHSWWFKWKKKMTTTHNKSSSFITIKNGNEIINLLKENGLYSQFFKIEDSIKIDEIHKILIPRSKETSTTVSPNVILFNNYYKKSEPFYLEREIDKEFNNSLKLNNIWVFGASGAGKTALVNRNLIINQIKYCYCDLSPVRVNSSSDVLEEILCKIEEEFDLSRNNKDMNQIKQIANLLCTGSAKKIIIVIDELAVHQDSILREIAADLIKLVTHVCNQSSDHSLKFVISTISNPRDIVEHQSKALEHFQYLGCEHWTHELEKLFDMLNQSLQLSLNSHKEKILESSKNSPRILKSIFRKIASLTTVTDVSISKAIEVTVNEIVG